MISRLLVVLVRGYQRLASPVLPPACRFVPTCSEYAAQAIEKHGPLRGVVLAARRIVRCAPWARGGYDPVPLRARGPAAGLDAAGRIPHRFE